jgi:hypothetical protein
MRSTSPLESWRTGLGRLCLSAILIWTVIGSLLAGVSGVQPAAAASADHLVLTGVQDPIVRGAVNSFTVQVVTAQGTVDTTYRGRITFSASDPAAQLPPDYTFTAGDAGKHSFSMNWVNSGSQSLTATDVADSTLTVSRSSIQVTQAVRIQIQSITDPIVRGQATSVTVTAVDFRGVADPRYSGAIHFTSTDSGATLPADYSFTAGDGGTHGFVFQLKWATPGTQSLTVTDTVNAGFTDTYNGIEVTQATQLAFAQITDPVVRGVPQTIVVSAKDAYGSNDPLFHDTVHFTSTDPGAILPADYTFVASDNGQHSFANGLTWATVGTRRLTVVDTTQPALTTTRTGIQVTATAGLRMQSITDPVMRGTATSVTVQAVDSLGNIDASYRGTVHFTSSDPGATLPADYTFTAADAGQHGFVFQLRWATPGDRTLTVKDTVKASFKASRSGITVTEATHLAFSGVSDPIGVHAINQFTVLAQDAGGRTDPLYRGTVHFSSTDGAATLPANYTFVAADNGAHSFSLSWGTPGSQTLTAKDTATGGPRGSQSGVEVTSTAAIQFQSIADPIARGTNTSIVVRALDASGNTDAGYRGTIHFTSDDPLAVLPGDYTFTAADGGAHGFFPFHWVTPGDHTLTVKDTVTAGLTSTRTGVTVTKAVKLQMSGIQDPIPVQANDSVQVRAVDQFGNPDALFQGTVHFTSNDASASLPPDYTFTTADAGGHSFNLVWRTPGTHTLTVTDSADSFQLTKTGIVATALVSLRLENLDEPIMRGTSDTFVVRAVDSHGTTATAYSGTVHFTSSDPSALIPADYTFTAADQGAHTFQLKWITPGTQSVTVTDTAVPSLNGTASGITVTKATRFLFTGIANPVANGVADSFTLAAVDDFGNVDTLYRGTIHFMSSDAGATLPADYTFLPADNGQHNFAVTWATPGQQSLTATDTGNATVTSTVVGITVT